MIGTAAVPSRRWTTVECAAILAPDGAWRSLVARVLWEHEVPGSNPGAPMSPRPHSSAVEAVSLSRLPAARRRASSGSRPHPDRLGVPVEPASRRPGVVRRGRAGRERRVGRERRSGGSDASGGSGDGATTGDVHARVVLDGPRRDVLAQPEGGLERPALTGPQQRDREAPPAARSAIQTAPWPPRTSARAAPGRTPARSRIGALPRFLTADPVRDEVARPREPRLRRLVDLDRRRDFFTARATLADQGRYSE